MNLKDVDFRELYRVWKYGLKEFRCFFRSTPFVALQVYDDFVLDEIKSDVNEDLLKKLLVKINEGDFCIVDLSFDTIMNLALLLNNEYGIKPVLNVNQVFNEYGIVGDKEDISRLVYTSMKLKKIKSDKFIMFFNYDRYNDDFDLSKIYDKLNNQYLIGDEDFPQKDFLKKLGYNKISVFTNTNIKNDLKEQIDFIKNAVEVEIIKVEI